MHTRATTKNTILFRTAVAVVLACATLSTGCKFFQRNKDKEGSGDSPTPKYDPLIGRNIPKQDLPIPNRDGYAEGRDPLLRNGNAMKDDREPYRSGPGTTPAALAAKPRDEAGVPSIDDRPTGTATGRGPVPFKPTGAAGEPTLNGVSFDQISAELRRIGATWQPARQGKNGETIFTCDVPLGANGEGPIRRYEGIGASETAAANDALKQIQTELKK